MFNNKGFTLIELLVVVLVIGILAAIAVPQYQLAVEKSRVATMLPILKAMMNAQQLYYDTNGTYAKTLDELDFEFPAGGTITSTRLGITYPDGRTYDIWTSKDGTSSSVRALSEPGEAAYIIEMYMDGPKRCYARQENAFANKVCQAFATQSEIAETTKWHYGYIW